MASKSGCLWCFVHTLPDEERPLCCSWEGCGGHCLAQGARGSMRDSLWPCLCWGCSIWEGDSQEFPSVLVRAACTEQNPLQWRGYESTNTQWCP